MRAHFEEPAEREAGVVAGAHPDGCLDQLRQRPRRRHHRFGKVESSSTLTERLVVSTEAVVQNHARNLHGGLGEALRSRRQPAPCPLDQASAIGISPPEGRE
jgi:hypothetical protein